MLRALAAVVALIVACVASRLSAQGVRPGVEVLLTDSLRILEGKRVGLISNHTGRDRQRRRDADLLYRSPGVRLVAQIHDAAIFDTPKAAVPAVVEMIEACWKEPLHIPKSIVCREERELLLPTDVKVGRRWSDFG
jgi:hypothetical protein